MGIKERIYFVVFALVIGIVGAFVLWVSGHGTSSVGPQVAGVVMFMGMIFVIAALMSLWIGLTPVRWWPKDFQNIIEQMK